MNFEFAIANLIIFGPGRFRRREKVGTDTYLFDIIK